MVRVFFLEMYGTITSLNICDLVRARFEGSVFQIYFVLCIQALILYHREENIFDHLQIEKLQ